MINRIELGGKDDSARDDYEEPTEESRRRYADSTLKEENARLQSQLRVRNAADAAGVKVPKTLFENLAGGLTDAQAKAIVNELKGGGSGGAQRPRSSTPTRQQQTGGALTESSPPSDPAKLGRWLNGR